MASGAETPPTLVATAPDQGTQPTRTSNGETTQTPAQSTTTNATPNTSTNTTNTSTTTSTTQHTPRSETSRSNRSPRHTSPKQSSTKSKQASSNTETGETTPSKTKRQNNTNKNANSAEAQDKNAGGGSNANSNNTNANNAAEDDKAKKKTRRAKKAKDATTTTTTAPPPASLPLSTPILPNPPHLLPTTTKTTTTTKITENPTTPTTTRTTTTTTTASSSSSLLLPSSHSHSSSTANDGVKRYSITFLQQFRALAHCNTKPPLLDPAYGGAKDKKATGREGGESGIAESAESMILSPPRLVFPSTVNTNSTQGSSLPLLSLTPQPKSNHDDKLSSRPGRKLRDPTNDRNSGPSWRERQRTPSPNRNEDADLWDTPGKSPNPTAIPKSRQRIIHDGVRERELVPFFAAEGGGASPANAAKSRSQTAASSTGSRAATSETTSASTANNSSSNTTSNSTTNNTNTNTNTHPNSTTAGVTKRAILPSELFAAAQAVLERSPPSAQTLQQLGASLPPGMQAGKTEDEIDGENAGSGNLAGDADFVDEAVLMIGGKRSIASGALPVAVPQTRVRPASDASNKNDVDWPNHSDLNSLLDDVFDEEGLLTTLSLGSDLDHPSTEPQTAAQRSRILTSALGITPSPPNTNSGLFAGFGAAQQPAVAQRGLLDQWFSQGSRAGVSGNDDVDLDVDVDVDAEIDNLFGGSARSASLLDTVNESKLLGSLPRGPNQDALAFEGRWAGASPVRLGVQPQDGTKPGSQAPPTSTSGGGEAPRSFTGDTFFKLFQNVPQSAMPPTPKNSAGETANPSAVQAETPTTAAPTTSSAATSQGMPFPPTLTVQAGVTPKSATLTPQVHQAQLIAQQQQQQQQPQQQQQQPQQQQQHAQATKQHTAPAQTWEQPMPQPNAQQHAMLQQQQQHLQMLQHQYMLQQQQQQQQQQQAQFHHIPHHHMLPQFSAQAQQQQQAQQAQQQQQQAAMLRAAQQAYIAHMQQQQQQQQQQQAAHFSHPHALAQQQQLMHQQLQQQYNMNTHSPMYGMLAAQMFQQQQQQQQQQQHMMHLHQHQQQPPSSGAGQIPMLERLLGPGGSNQTPPGMPLGLSARRPDDQERR